MSLVTLIEADEQVILGEWGLGEPWKSRGSTPLEYSYCQYAQGSAAPLLIPDARHDPRVSASPAISENNWIAYAGIPLVYENQVLGALCVVDTQPRVWQPDEVAMLQELAASVLTELALRAEMMQRKRHAQRLDTLGEVSAAVAHDLRNIMTVIGGNAEMMLADLPNDHPNRQEAVEVQRAATRANELLRQLVDFSGDRRPQRVRVNVPQAVSALQPMLRRVLGSSYWIVPRHRGTDLVVSIDQGQFEQVLMNLVVNARDAMQHGGRIRISSCRQVVDGRSYVVTNVTDHGSGMAPEQVDRIFDPFFTTKPPGEGTGIGLTTIAGIIEDADGFIRVRSRLGSGSRFSVYLPAQSDIS